MSDDKKATIEEGAHTAIVKRPLTHKFAEGERSSDDDTLLIETGPQGNPIIVAVNSEQLVAQKFDEAMNAIEERGKARMRATATGTVVRKPGLEPTVEVEPGIMVSQVLIDEAVRLTSNPVRLASDLADELLAKAAVRANVHDEIKQDISTSKQIVQAMVDRAIDIARNPMKYDEKFVSYDTMPDPLKRVVKAYMDVGAANKELEDAIKGLQALAPVTSN